MKQITILPSGYGHWKISMQYYNKTIITITNNSQAIDDYKSEDWEKDGRVLRKNRGYNLLKNELVNEYRAIKQFFKS